MIQDCMMRSFSGLPEIAFYLGAVVMIVAEVWAGRHGLRQASWLLFYHGKLVGPRWARLLFAACFVFAILVSGVRIYACHG